MREFLRTKGFKMTPQRELVFRSFFELGEHVTVDELYEAVRSKDSSVGYSTVWRNLKLICKVGLAQEVNLGDGVTRYDRTTATPHGHLFCVQCKRLVEFDADTIVVRMSEVADENRFKPSEYKIEVRGTCRECAAGKSVGSDKEKQH